MSTQAAHLGELPARDAQRLGRRYVAEVAQDWRKVRDDWTGTGTPFQGRTWIGSWYDEIGQEGDVQPVLITLRDAASGEVALRLPLVARHEDGMRVVEFADLSLTDYNAPLLGPAAPRDRTAAMRAMRAVRHVLPAADLLRLAKMPSEIKGRANPLVLHPAAMDCALNGNVVRMGADYDDWRRSLGRTYRKELERSWRVFTRAEDAIFERITDPEVARDVMATLEKQQGDRMRAVGNAYALDAPAFSRFYRTMAARGVADGSVIVTALRAEGEIVASLVGLRDQDSYIMVRISQAGGRWANCSPGRLVIERTLAMLHADGCRSFDFSIGNYDYKRRFDTMRTPLFDYVAPLSWRGVKAAARARTVGYLRKYPLVDARLRAVQAKLFGPRTIAAQEPRAEG